MVKVMAVNAGSSSLKFQLINMPSEEVITSGLVERIGLDQGNFEMKYNGEKFINWELDKKMFFKNIKFKTFNRTIFNNKQENETFDIFDY